MRNLIAPAALIAGLVLSSAAFAAPPADTAPIVLQQQDLGRNSVIGAPIADVSASQAVSEAGLNLSNPADVKKLDRRIDAAANRTCEDLRANYPPDFYPKIDGGSCVIGAEHRAMSAVDAQRDVSATAGN
jgi:UrcA family protein